MQVANTHIWKSEIRFNNKVRKTTNCIRLIDFVVSLSNLKCLAQGILMCEEFFWFNSELLSFWNMVTA